MVRYTFARRYGVLPLVVRVSRGTVRKNILAVEIDQEMQSSEFLHMTRREVEDYLIERAMVEADFRRRLLTEPEKLLAEIGLPIGSGVKVRVLEEEPKSFYIVLPRALREVEELEDVELEGVAGGAGLSDMQRFLGYR
jgi:hypothetical protein